MADSNGDHISVISLAQKIHRANVTPWVSRIFTFAASVNHLLQHASARDVISFSSRVLTNTDISI
jgi:hypothetical protein